MPKIQPVTKDFFQDFFSRSIAKNKGTSATHARIENSKSGNARISKTAERIAKPIFENVGKIVFNEASFIIYQFSKKLFQAQSCKIGAMIYTFNKLICLENYD